MESGTSGGHGIKKTKKNHEVERGGGCGGGEKNIFKGVYYSYEFMRIQFIYCKFHIISPGKYDFKTYTRIFVEKKS
jgi:hypothetical protein